MQYLRQSTASQEISLGQFLDSTDGNSEEDGLTIANTDIKLRKGGTTTLANKNSGGATSISNGVYHATLDATDSNTLGMLEIYVHVAGALAVKNTYMVIPAASYDAIVTNGLNDIAATAIVSAGAINTSSGAITTVTTAINLTNLPSIPANWLTAAGIAASALNGKGDWNIGKTGYSLTQVFPTNFADMSIAITTGLMDITQAAADKAWGTAARTITAATNITSDGAAINATAGTIDLVTATSDMRGTDGANTVVPDAAGVVPTAVQNRQEMDTNSVDLDQIQTNQTTINNNVLLIDTAPMRGTDSAFLAASAPANFSALGINVGGDISVVTLVDVTTLNSDMVGTNNALLAASINLTGGAVDAVTDVTNDVGITQAGADKVWLSVSRTLTDGIQKNVAFSNLEFLMVLASDHVTPATGLVVTGERSIDGGAFAPVAGTIAEVSNGIYQVDLLAADTNGDVITYRFSSATADDTFITVTTA